MSTHLAPAEGTGPAPGFWTSVREALRGSHHDYTDGPIGRSILLLSVPMVLEMAMESVFAIVDIFFVSRLGADAVAAVGLTESLLAIVYALAMGLGIGATALVARRIGEKDAEGAAHSAVQAILLALIISAVLGIAGSLLAPHLLGLMGASPEVIRTGTGYARVMLGGEAAIIILFVVNAIFRGAGDAAIAMRVLWLANLINIVLCPCFIFGLGPFPRLGVTGAAVATTIGRSAGAAFALWRLSRPDGRIPVARRHLRPDWAAMGRILRLSSTATLQMLIGTASWIGMARIVAAFGSPVLAGYTVGMRVVIFALLPSFGLSNAAATMVGQGLGAGKPERAERAVWKACTYNLVFLGVVGLVFVVLAGPIIRFFSTDPEVVRHGAAALRVVAAGFPLYAYGMVLTQAFNGAGDTWTPTWINLAVFWAFEIPAAYLLSRAMGPVGAFLAITIAFSLLAVVSGVIFRRGTWKTKRV
ncbi:MAG TPA: MATE family efflux transporter [Longimicrobium sp.]|jgi:putative MATE family efflux protein|uniref:MATE family efflux transporter n=1 Tax=Longimicrobium sp. TaxID=2029185 RepID=UPI002EDA8054